VNKTERTHMNKQPRDGGTDVFKDVYLGFALDEPAVEGGFEDRRIVAGEFSVSDEISAGLFITCVDGHGVLQIPGDLLISEGLNGFELGVWTYHLLRGLFFCLTFSTRPVDVIVICSVYT